MYRQPSRVTANSNSRGSVCSCPQTTCMRRLGGVDDPVAVSTINLIMKGESDSFGPKTQGYYDILSKGKAFLNAPQTSRGQTLLYTAARRGNFGAVAKLLSMGANVDARNTDGSTPLHGAAYGFDNLVQSTDPAVRKQDMLDRLEVMSKLVNANADRNILKTPEEKSGSIKSDLRGFGLGCK